MPAIHSFDSSIQQGEAETVGRLALTPLYNGGCQASFVSQYTWPQKLHFISTRNWVSLPYLTCSIIATAVSFFPTSSFRFLCGKNTCPHAPVSKFSSVEAGWAEGRMPGDDQQLQARDGAEVGQALHDGWHTDRNSSWAEEPSPQRRRGCCLEEIFSANGGATGVAGCSCQLARP